MACDVVKLGGEILIYVLVHQGVRGLRAAEFGIERAEGDIDQPAVAHRLHRDPAHERCNQTALVWCFGCRFRWFGGRSRFDRLNRAFAKGPSRTSTVSAGGAAVPLNSAASSRCSFLITRRVRVAALQNAYCVL